MLLRDFECNHCGAIREELISAGEDVTCDVCGHSMVKIFMKAPHEFKVIVPDYPGSKALKAGYVHSHGNKPAEKVQVSGWTPDPK